MAGTADIRYAQRVRQASRALTDAGDAKRSDVLRTFAAALRRDAPEILGLNDDDVSRARDNNGVSGAVIDRLRLDESRLEEIARGVEQVASLPDPLDHVLDERTLLNGLQLRRVAVPFGVIGVVYEARPGVSADAAALAIKTGNGAVLRGSTMAESSNEAIIARVWEALEEHGISRDCIWFFPPIQKNEFRDLIADERALDLVIPRGGEGLKRFLMEHARVPVLAAAGGNCHVFVDESADRDIARDIVINAKTQRPGVCNAAETLLVHENRAHDLLPYLVAHLEGAGVTVRTDEAALGEEFLDMVIAVATVASVDEAIDHVNRYGTRHSEAIVTDDAASVRAFTQGVDAAVVYVNASTRFTDGAEFGLGAEVGISTGKLHARGPIGLRELTTSKYVVHGDGHIRA